MKVITDDDGLTELGGGGEELLGQGEGLARHQRLVLVLQAAQLELGACQRTLKQITLNIFSIGSIFFLTLSS